MTESFEQIEAVAEQFGDAGAENIEGNPEITPEQVAEALRKFKSLIKTVLFSYVTLFGAGVGRDKIADKIFEEETQEYIQRIEELKGFYGQLVRNVNGDVDKERLKFREEWPFKSFEEFEAKKMPSLKGLKVDAEIGKIESSNDHDRLNKIIAKLPSGWLEDVGKIEQVDSSSESNDKYGLSSDWKTLASANRGAYRGKTKIVLYKSTKKLDIFDNLETAYHEIGHANDWDGDLTMTGEERVTLLLMVSQRLNSEDRYKSEYVESIKNPDKREERYLKAVEYWAEICSAYFANPHSLNAKDFILVDSQIRRRNPDYLNHPLIKY